MAATPTPAKRILAVEDEASIRSFVARVLRDAGYVVVTAADAADALGVVDQSEPFDLLLTDLVMPGMRGDELARHLRKTHPDLRVLYFTGYSDSLFDDRQLLWANEAFLEKPVDRNGLLEAVHLILEGTTRPPGA